MYQRVECVVVPTEQMSNFFFTDLQSLIEINY